MSSKHKEYILVLEDDPMHVELIRRSFLEVDKEKIVEFVTTLKDARARISECVPLIVISDLNLPDGKGYEIIVSVNDKHAFPVVIMTSFGTEGIAVDIMKKGALDYVVKSEETFSHLPHTVERALSHWGEIRRRIDTEKKLKKSEEEYKDLYENAPDMFCSVDAKTGLIHNCNQTLANNLGFSKNELIGESIFKVYHPDCYQGVKKAFHSFVERGEVRDTELELQRKDGTKINVSLNVSSFKDQAGQVIHSRSIWRDITEKKHAEWELKRSHEKLENRVKERTAELEIAKNEAESADRLKSLFIASMSHELRTPLNSIIGFNGIILQGMAGNINPKQKDYLSRAYKSSQHLLGLINDVIDISKIETGVVEVSPEFFNLEEVVTEVIGCACVQEMKSKEIEFKKVNIPPGLEIYNDRKRVLQCLLNYLSNAAKFTQSGSVCISAKEVGDEVEIVVEDTGIGIAETDLPKLFRQFERLQSPARIPILGAGLGLYLTKKLATEILGGSVRVESQLDVGSKFFLRFPKNLKLQKSEP